MTSLGILVSGVAHEINNPTNFIMINISVLRKLWEKISMLLNDYEFRQGAFSVGNIKSGDLNRYLDDLIGGIEEGAERIRNIVNNLKDYARQSPVDMSGTFNINHALRRALLLVTNLLKKSTENYTIDYGENLPEIKGDIRRVEQVIINIIQNACHAIEAATQSVRIRTFLDHGRGMVVFEVADEGVGISEDNLKNITDPFFTTRRDEGGTGLGLSISMGIIKDHKGRFEVDSYPGKGTVVRVLLPIDDSGKALNENGKGEDFESI